MGEHAAEHLGALLEAIRAEAEEEAARVMRQAQREALAIADQAQQDAARLEREPVEAQEPQLEAECRRRLAVARMGAADQLRRAREAAFEEALDALRAHLGRLRGQDVFAGIFAALLDEALSALPSATRVLVDPRDLVLAAARIDGRELEPAIETWGGVVITAEDGRAVRNTLEERLANADATLRLELSRIARSGSEGR